MANSFPYKLTIRITGLALILAGCEGQSMDQIVGIGDANPPVAEASKAPRRPVSTPTPPPPPSPKPSATNVILKRNLAFDNKRSEGIGHVMTGMIRRDISEIDAGVSSFNEADRMRPNDKSVKIWLDAIAAGRMRSKNPAAFQNPAAMQGLMPNTGAGRPMLMLIPNPGANAPAVGNTQPVAPAVQPNGQVDPRYVF